MNLAHPPHGIAEASRMKLTSPLHVPTVTRTMVSPLRPKVDNGTTPNDTTLHLQIVPQVEDHGVHSHQRNDKSRLTPIQIDVIAVGNLA